MNMSLHLGTAPMVSMISGCTDFPYASRRTATNPIHELLSDLGPCPLMEKN
jgi:hypothetical protein